MKAFVKPYTEDKQGNNVIAGYYEVHRIYANEVDLVYIDTEKKKKNIFTVPLSRILFIKD